MGFWRRWLAALEGIPRDTGRDNPAFDWIRGRVGQRQNPDGMRSLVHYGVFFAAAGLLVNAAIALPDGWTDFFVLSAVQVLWTSGFLALLVFNVGFLETLDGRPLSHLNGANIITLGRMVLLPSLAYVIAFRDFAVAAPAYVALALSDVADGLWARYRNQVTKLGIVLDPLVDIAFFLWTFVALWKAGLIPPWILALALLRSGLLVFGGAGLYLSKGQIRVFPTPLGKATGVLVTTACASLLVWPGTLAAGPAVPGWVLNGLAVVLAATILHVIAIGVINLKLPLREEPVRTPVRGRWARSIRRRMEESRASGARPPRSFPPEHGEP